MDTAQKNMMIARTITGQIGRPALYMIGAKNLIADGPSLVFTIMRNAKKVRHIKIKLDEASDTYDVEFFRLKRGTYEKITIKEYTGIYADQLHQLISMNTGLALSL